MMRGVGRRPSPGGRPRVSKRSALWVCLLLSAALWLGSWLVFEARFSNTSGAGASPQQQHGSNHGRHMGSEFHRLADGACGGAKAKAATSPGGAARRTPHFCARQGEEGRVVAQGQGLASRTVTNDTRTRSHATRASYVLRCLPNRRQRRAARAARCTGAGGGQPPPQAAPPAARQGSAQEAGAPAPAAPASVVVCAVLQRWGLLQRGGQLRAGAAQVRVHGKGAPAALPGGFAGCPARSGLLVGKPWRAVLGRI